MRERIRRLDLLTAWSVFFMLLICYCLCVPPTVSYWDCPEYVAAARWLEVGHPPGNPTWMLAERIVTMFAPSARYVALAVNLSSAIFTAFAGFFLSRIIFATAMFVLTRLRRARPRLAAGASPLRRRIAAGGRISRARLAAGAALTGSLIFGWGDSVWFSAVEAEVYAMSIFMTALCCWLMVKWAATPDRAKAWRLLILIAYLFGLSIGIHQLNLLCIPALAMVWAVKRRLRTPRAFILVFLLSIAVVACVLVGMMPSTILLASRLELFAVNTLRLPWLSGVAAYVILLGISLITALAVTAVSTNRGLMAAAIFPALFLSGIFIFGRNILAGAAISAIAALLLVRADNFSARRLNLSLWMLAMLLTGYSSYALIPIRGDVPSPANAQMPGDPFSFASYQGREQYGHTPLLYGRTPYSKPMLKEEWKEESLPSKDSKAPKALTPVYTHYRLEDIHPLYYRNDSTRRYEERGAYRMPVYTPELDMWFPRITEGDPFALSAYSEWIGMDASTMDRVRISEAFDTIGRPVAKATPGQASPLQLGNPEALRPTYAQHLQWLLGYQTGYMYFRYLLWNFSGRQNDFPSQGEVQEGNFITGYPLLDEAMLGPDEEMPDYAGRDNPGRNRYFMLPLLLGIVGLVWLCRARRRGQQTAGITAVLFVMTGLAIVVYLNQGPGEPRERDYSFLGSYFAFSIWVGFGALALARACRSVWVYAAPLALAGWMLYQNFDDHDRSGRTVARNLTVNVMEAVPSQAILFVNGDNFTFPEWYVQEVEGVRRDVRVVNLAYLNTYSYAANLLQGWRESKPLPSLLSARQILAGDFRNVRFDISSGDTIDAVSLLHRISEHPDSLIPYGYTRLPASPHSESVVIPLKRLSRSGNANLIEFRRLMQLNLLTADLSEGYTRPMVWMHVEPSAMRFGLDSEEMTPWLYGLKYGREQHRATDSLLMAAIYRHLPPNPLPLVLDGDPQTPYMDYTPASMVSGDRGALIRAARLLLRDDSDQPRAPREVRLLAALRALRMADRELGNHPLSYGAVRFDDALIKTRRDLGELMMEMADTLTAASPTTTSAQAATSGTLPKASPTALELRARGKRLTEEEKAKTEAWQRYRNSLPLRLRSKIASPL